MIHKLYYGQSKNANNYNGYMANNPVAGNIIGNGQPSLSSSFGLVEELEPEAIPMTWVCVNLCN